MATLGLVSADGIVRKDRPLHKDWTALYVGDDMGHAPGIIRRAQVIVGRTGERSVDQVATAIAQAYDERLQAQIERKILRKCSFTTQSFREHGKRRMTEAAYNRVIDRMDRETLKCTFLVGGFEAKDQPRLFTVDNEDEPLSYDDLGFWAIGSGANVAMGSLAFFADKGQFNSTNSLEECIYFVCQAKFMADTAVRTVGRQTIIVIRKFNNPMIKFLSPIGERRIRAQWEKRGAPRIVPGLTKDITKFVFSLDEAMEDIDRFRELFFTPSQIRAMKARQSASQKSTDQR